MGDPHYNTWGGKNNSWGNRNRKNQTSNNRNNNSGGGGDFNKGAKILVCGVFLFALAHTGFGWVGETIDNISDVFEAKSKIEEVQSNRNNSSNSKPKSKNIKKEYNSVKGKIDIEADDVKDILEYLYDKLSDNNIDTKDTDIVFTDYKALKDAKSYNKNIVKKLKKYSNPVTFVLINDGSLSSDEMETEYNRAFKLAQDNNDFSKTKFNSVIVAGRYNSPSSGNMIISLTFS